jgi:hypothetical protein
LKLLPVFRGRKSGGAKMPKRILQLTTNDEKILAYDDLSGRFFLMKLEPFNIKMLNKDELAEVVDIVLGGSESGKLV